MFFLCFSSPDSELAEANLWQLSADCGVLADQLHLAKGSGWDTGWRGQGQQQGHLQRGNCQEVETGEK